jgi:hypothetical protein
MDDHKYSGQGSARFWIRVGKLKDAADHQELYSLGVALQNLEEQVLRLLLDAEKRKDVEFPR